MKPDSNRQYLCQMHFFKSEILTNSDDEIRYTYGFVGSFLVNGIRYDISGNLEKGSMVITLEPHQTFSPSQPDERFFLRYTTRSGEELYESLLHKGYFIRYDSQMSTCMMDKLTNYTERVTPEYKFQSFCAHPEVEFPGRNTQDKSPEKSYPLLRESTV